MKKQSKKVLLSAATLAAMLGAAPHADAATKATLNITAKIISAISIAATKTLKFGTFYYTAAGSLQVKTDDSTKALGGVKIVGTNAKAGGFKVKGANGQVADFALTAPSVTIKNGAGTKTMAVKSFVFGTASKTVGSYDVALTGGAQNGNAVGAKLTVAGTEAAGSYTGTVKITAAYQ